MRPPQDRGRPWSEARARAWRRSSVAASLGLADNILDMAPKGVLLSAARGRGPKQLAPEIRQSMPVTPLGWASVHTPAHHTDGAPLGPWPELDERRQKRKRGSMHKRTLLLALAAAGTLAFAASAQAAYLNVGTSNTYAATTTLTGSIPAPALTVKNGYGASASAYGLYGLLSNTAPSANTAAIRGLNSSTNTWG